MLDSTTILVIVRWIVLAIVAAPYVYAVYWGLAIRRGLVMRTYRNQALAMSAIAGYFVLGWIVGNVFGNQSQVLLFALFSLSSDATIFFWLDATVRVARRSDPYERDNLHWSKTKFFLAAGIIIAAGITLTNAPIAAVFGLGVGVPTSVPIIYQVLGFGQYLALMLTTAAVLLVSAVRSKDRTLQNHLKWFGLFPAMLFVGLAQLGLINYFFSGTVSNTVGNTTSIGLLYIFLGLGGYCLYRSARSLSRTTSRLELVE
jgi:hypothetical protein